MTSLERLLAAADCRPTDRPARLAWFVEDALADATVSKAASKGPVVLADVPNPFGLALRRGIDLNKALKDDPSVGGAVLDELVDEVRKTISDGLDGGADGIFYRLHGATPRHCSPMQYGGYYLERDRELLSEQPSSVLKVLFIAAEDEPYVDFVSDLPAQVFAWDVALTNITAADVRAARQGAVASSDPTSEICLVIGKERYLDTLERPESE